MTFSLDCSDDYECLVTVKVPLLSLTAFLCSFLIIFIHLNHSGKHVFSSNEMSN